MHVLVSTSKYYAMLLTLKVHTFECIFFFHSLSIIQPYHLTSLHDTANYAIALAILRLCYVVNVLQRIIAVWVIVIAVCT